MSTYERDDDSVSLEGSLARQMFDDQQPPLPQVDESEERVLLGESAASPAPEDDTQILRMAAARSSDEAFVRFLDGFRRQVQEGFQQMSARLNALDSKCDQLSTQATSAQPLPRHPDPNPNFPSSSATPDQASLKVNKSSLPPVETMEVDSQVGPSSNDNPPMIPALGCVPGPSQVRERFPNSYLRPHERPSRLTEETRFRRVDGIKLRVLDKDRRLEREGDFKYWKRSIVGQVESVDCLFILDPEERVPTDLSSSDLCSLKRKVRYFIFESLGAYFQDLVNEIKDPMALMDKLILTCDPSSKFHLRNLVNEFNSIRYHPGRERAVAFIARFDRLHHKVVSMNPTMFSDDYVRTIFELAIESTVTGQKVELNSSPFTLPEMKNMLLEEQLKQDQSSSGASLSLFRSNVSRSSRVPTSNRSDERQSTSKSKAAILNKTRHRSGKRPYCTYCKRTGHSREGCFKADRKCFRCGQANNHVARDCPNPSNVESVPFYKTQSLARPTPKAPHPHPSTSRPRPHTGPSRPKTVQMPLGQARKMAEHLRSNPDAVFAIAGPSSGDDSARVWVTIGDEEAAYLGSINIVSERQGNEAAFSLFKGYNSYAYNDTTHTDRETDEILSVGYEDGKWSKPYYDCGGGNIWMLTYTVPFFGYSNGTYFFKGTSGIDIDLRRVDIDQCPLPAGSTQLNIFAASDKCKKRTTQCVPIGGLGFRRGSYKCVCKRGFYFPDTKARHRYYNGTQIEEEYEKLMLGDGSDYNKSGVFECLSCAEGCEACVDESPCVVSLNWLLRTAILILSCLPICCLPFVLIFTWKYANIKVVRAASPVLLRVITLGAFFIYCTTIVMYPRPNIVTCTARVWLREIGFSLTYGALMLKTWRISVIFRVRSAKAVKITDMDLLKRLGMIVAAFSVLLIIRTLVAPPKVIIGKTADDLKAYLCQTDWWDHSFTILEVLFLIWGIRLCIVVRKAPSEFNESKFISMAIYNEFLLSLFLNISMLFLQSPANPDLLYIIFFCHTQMTVTLLLCFIFGSKAYLVFKGLGKSEDTLSAVPKVHITKFLNKPRSGTSQYAVSTNSSTAGVDLKLTEHDIQEEFKRLYLQLEQLKEKNMRHGNRHLAARISAMQEAGRLQTTDEIEETALDKTDESSTSNCNESQSDQQGSGSNQPSALGAVIRSAAKYSKPDTSPTIPTDSKANGNSSDSGKGDSKVGGGETTKTRVPPQVPARGGNKSMSKMPVHLNLDDSNRFTEEVTV